MEPILMHFVLDECRVIYRLHTRWVLQERTVCEQLQVWRASVWTGITDTPNRHNRVKHRFLCTSDNDLRRSWRSDQVGYGGKSFF